MFNLNPGSDDVPSSSSWIKVLQLHFSASIKKGLSWRKWRAPSVSVSCACCLARNMPVLINESSLVTFAGSLPPKWMFHISSKLSHKQKWALPRFTRLAKLSEREVSPLPLRALNWACNLVIRHWNILQKTCLEVFQVITAFSLNKCIQFSITHSGKRSHLH